MTGQQRKRRKPGTLLKAALADDAQGAQGEHLRRVTVGCAEDGCGLRGRRRNGRQRLPRQRRTLHRFRRPAVQFSMGRQ